MIDMIKNFKPRLYQQTILATCVDYNTLVILPTGMGKTNLFLMVVGNRLKNHPDSKILLLGPTRPLIEQYYEVFKKFFEIEESEMAIFTGMVTPKKREELWKTSKIIFSTPQGLENDIISGRISLEDVSLVGFDEAHRAVGDYAYVFLAKEYYKRARYPRIIGLTASPGDDVEKITEVCKNLNVEEIEIRTEDDPDVKPYIQEVDIQWVKVDLPKEFIQIQKHLKTCLKSKLDTVKEKGYVKIMNTATLGKKELLGMQGALHSEIAQGNRDYEVMKAISLIAEAMKVHHALELLESQGITPLYNYMQKLNTESRTTKTKAVQNLVKDLNFRTAFVLTHDLYEEKVEHPKMTQLKKIVQFEITKHKDYKMIIFSQFRDTGAKIVEELKDIEGVRPVIFVGQMKKKNSGMSQKEQREVLDKFRSNGHNILVATSVAEEGLDIPSVDTVMFYEPVPSVIRTIQRRGRTGRQDKGSVIVLMSRNTRDEGYRWSTHHKQKRMYRTLETLKKKMSFAAPKKDRPLKEFFSEHPLKVYADNREKGSGIIKELLEKDIKIELQKLEVGDYVVSDRCAIEVKSVPDFVDSIVDGRLLDQIKALKQQFERPLVLIHGKEDIYSQRKIHPNAIRGMLATITISYGIPVLQVSSLQEAAAQIAVIAKREQDETPKDFQPHGSKKPLTLKDQQEYIVSSLPGVGLGLAKPLLEKFKTIKKLINAKEDRLQKVEKIGKIKAREIRKVLDEEYHNG